MAVIPLRRSLLTSSSNLPGSCNETGRFADAFQRLPPLFGLAPRGVFPANPVTRAAVRSYRTFSPLPQIACFQAKCGGIFSVALIRRTRFERAPPAVSRHAALWRPDFPRKRPCERRRDCLPRRSPALL